MPFIRSPDKAPVRGSAVTNSTDDSSSGGSSASGEVASLDSNSDSNNGFDSLGAPPSFTLSVLAEPREIVYWRLSTSEIPTSTFI